MHDQTKFDDRLIPEHQADLLCYPNAQLKACRTKNRSSALIVNIFNLQILLKWIFKTTHPSHNWLRQSFKMKKLCFEEDMQKSWRANSEQNDQRPWASKLHSAGQGVDGGRLQGRKGRMRGRRGCKLSLLKDQYLYSSPASSGWLILGLDTPLLPFL